MATRHSQSLAKWAVAPAVIILFLWMIVPLVMTIYFSFLRYNLLNPDSGGWAGLSNYYYFITDESFPGAVFNTLALVASVIIVSVLGGLGLALLLDQPFWGRGIVRLLVISPFFIMPTVSALVWKNLLMNPIYGLFAYLQELVGITPLDWFAKVPLLSVAIIASWQWLPFSALIILTALQSLDEEQKDASAMDGAGFIPYFRYIVLPHLARPITVVILIETIFLLNIFAEIYVTSVGGLAGNLTYLVYFQGLLNFDIGEASAGGLIAVVLANLVSIFLVRIIGRNLEI